MRTKYNDKEQCSKCSHWQTCKYRQKLHDVWNDLVSHIKNKENFWADLDEFIGNHCHHFIKMPHYRR